MLWWRSSLETGNRSVVLETAERVGFDGYGGSWEGLAGIGYGTKM